MSEKYLLKITLREEFPHLEKENVLFQGVLRGTEDRDTSEHDNIMTNAKQVSTPPKRQAAVAINNFKTKLYCNLSQVTSAASYFYISNEKHCIVTNNFLCGNIIFY